MRLLQLNPDGTEESALDFHPTITVVNGLGVGGREVVIRAVAAIARGQDPGLGGLVEAHGIMFDLTPDTLSLLDLHTDLEVLLEAADMQGNGAAAEPQSATTRVSVEQFLQKTAPGVYPALDKARRAQSDASEAFAVLTDAAERSQNEHQKAVWRLDRARAAVDHARAALQAALAGLEADTGAAQISEQELVAQRDELERDIEQLRADLERIDRGLQQLSAIDTRPIQVLLDAIASPDTVDLVPSERAQELADEFVRLQAAAAELEARLELEGRNPTSAMAQLEAARAELHKAERGIAKPDLSPEDVAELEAVHEDVLEAERRASGRFNRSKRSLDDVLAKEQAVLDRVGFPTWSAYVMGAGLLAIDPAAEQRLEKARFEFEAAEAHWAQISAAIEADPEHSALLDQLEAVYLEAFDLLGGQEPEDLETALRQHKEAKREITIDELVDALAYQLELVGLDLGSAPSLDRTVVVAEAFLAEASGINERVEELEGERHHVVGALEEAEEELTGLPSPDAVEGGFIDLTGTDAPVAVELTAEDVAELEAELAAATEEEHETAERVEAREALVDAATQVHAVATARLMRTANELAEQQDGAEPPSSESAFQVPVDDVDGDAGQEAVEFYLLSRLASMRNVSFAGSVPLVVDDAFTGLASEDVRSLLGKLEKMAEAVQIIYLTDDEVITNWAIEVGFQRAAVVEATGPFT
jgi:hypothetical protein